MSKRRKASIMAPFVGNGKLTDYKDKSDSWIYDQMTKKEVKPGITVNKDDFIRFSAIKNKIASKLVFANEMIQVVKEAKQLSSTTTSNYRFALCWRLSGSINGSSIEELNLVKELLWSKVDSDIQELSFVFNATLEKIGKVKIDMDKMNLFCESVLSFEVNILSDDKKIREAIKNLGFDFGEELN